MNEVENKAIIFLSAMETSGRSLALGIDENAEYSEQQREIAGGQILVIGTDGIWEARNSKGEMFGKDKFKAVIREKAGASAKEILVARVPSM